MGSGRWIDNDPTLQWNDVMGSGTTIWAGVVEGFYGEPWTHSERLAWLHDSPSMGLRTYLYAPKADPWHRDEWREPYPRGRLAELSELARAAEAAGVRLIWALAPGLSLRYADEGDQRALVAKAEQLWSAGIRHYALLFDDVPPLLTDAGDIAAFGSGPAALGLAQGSVCRLFADRFAAPHGIADPPLVCPTDYAGCAVSPYRSALGGALPAGTRILWTGRDIIVRSVTRAEIDEAAASYGHRLVLWDNFPVNDFDRSRVFLGPLPDRTGDLAGAPLDGILSNPMVEAAASRLPLSTVGEWARDPARFDPLRAADAALRAWAGPAASVLRPLVRACSSWPPSAIRDAALADAVHWALDGDRGGIEEVERYCADLGRVRHGDDPMLTSLAPWIDAARHLAAAALAACRLLRADDAARPAAWAAARDALDLAERDFADVLRPLLVPFVRQALRRTGGTGRRAPRRAAIVLTGSPHTLADDETVAWLERRAIAATLRSDIPAGAADGADLVIVTPRATAEAARAAAAAKLPLMAWGRLISLGLATESGVLLASDRVRVGGGELRVHRGPGKVTWCAPVAGAEILARSSGAESRPVLVRIAAGTPLSDGTPAPAARLIAFLTEDGAARWLLTLDGWRLLDDALDELLRGERTAG